MASPFLHLTAAEVRARLVTIASGAAGAPVVVRVGEEAYGYRNVGVDLPRSRTKQAGSALRGRVRAALEAARVVLAENAIAPKVGGTLRGQVQVTEEMGSGISGDASHLGQGPRSEGGGEGRRS